MLSLTRTAEISPYSVETKVLLPSLFTNSAFKAPLLLMMIAHHTHSIKTVLPQIELLFNIVN